MFGHFGMSWMCCKTSKDQLKVPGCWTTHSSLKILPFCLSFPAIKFWTLPYWLKWLREAMRAESCNKILKFLSSHETMHWYIENNIPLLLRFSEANAWHGAVVKMGFFQDFDLGHERWRCPKQFNEGCIGRNIMANDSLEEGECSAWSCSIVKDGDKSCDSGFVISRAEKLTKSDHFGIRALCWAHKSFNTAFRALKLIACCSYSIQ